MIKIAIVDDDKDELVRSKAQCIAFATKHPEYGIKISTFENAHDLLSLFESKGKYDIMILDIYMPSITGIELARSLRQGNYMGEIIFLTSSLSHAIEAFSLNATHYIVKPYTEEQFDSALDKAIFQLDKKKKASLPVKTSSGIELLVFADFLYAETDSHKQNIHLSDNRTIRVRMTSHELYDCIAQDRRFYKYGCTYILNLEKIQEITSKAIVLDNGTHIQMQRRQYKPLVENYTQFSLQGE